MTEEKDSDENGMIHCTCCCKKDYKCGMVCFSKREAWVIGFAFGAFTMFATGLGILRCAGYS